MVDSKLMDLNLTPQQLRFRDEMRAWLAANIPPGWQKRHASLKTMEERFAYIRAWQKKVYEAGWAGVAWPREYGGRGASIIEQVIFIEEMARAPAPPLANVLGIAVIGPSIIAYGTQAQNDLHLYYRRAKASEILFGDAAYHRERIAKIVVDRN